MRPDLIEVNQYVVGKVRRVFRWVREASVQEQAATGRLPACSACLMILVSDGGPTSLAAIATGFDVLLQATTWSKGVRYGIVDSNG